jgi:hypothetical protein
MPNDPWTDAWREVETSVPASVITYHTLELIHTVFVTPPSVRVVLGVGTDQTLTLEDGAPFNGNEPVVWKAVQFEADLAEFGEAKVPEVRLKIDNVQRELMPSLEGAVLIRSDLRCLFRQWRSDDTDAPCYGPVEFIMKRVSANRTSLSGVARIDDLMNIKIPSRIFTLNEFPGLRRNG